MRRAVRNLGRSGLAACAISAVDAALWDLKARHLKLPSPTFSAASARSSPFTAAVDSPTTPTSSCRAALGVGERDGCHSVKMKIGSEPERDPERVAAARAAIGERELFVDANGAYSVKQALLLCGAFERAQVRWFEEPVTSDDPAGLRMMRERAPAGIDIAAGEYVYTLDDARRLLEPPAVDVLQADVTRCGGITGFLKIAALCEAHHVGLSGHCAPALHRHVACAVPSVRHLEWFHDHVRIEQMLFEGAPRAANGMIRPDLGRPGHGLEFKSRDAERFSVNGGESR